MLRNMSPFFKLAMPSNDRLTWDAFLCLSQWGTLRWTCDGHVDSLIFLDLRMSIGPDHHLIFQTY